MSSRKRNSLIMLIIACVLGVAVVVSAVLLILQRVGGLESITISPTFADTELDVNMDYAISVNTDPSGAKVAKFDFVSDSSSATFEYKDDGVAVIHTNGEGAVTVYVEGKGVESNKLTFNIVDKAAQAAAEAAAAQAAAEAEALAAQQAAEEAAAAEAAAAAQVVYVKVIKDSVNVRSAANTDCDIVGKAKQGDTFEVINDDGSWTELKFGDQTGFIRNDMIQVVSEGEEVSATTPAPTEEKKEEAKTEEKKEEKTAEQKAAEEAAAAQKAAEEAAQKAAEEAAAQAAALAAAQPVGYTINCADGPASFTQQQYNFIKGFWSYTGDWEASAHKHTKSELISVCQVEGGIY